VRIAVDSSDRDRVSVMRKHFKGIAHLEGASLKRGSLKRTSRTERDLCACTILVKPLAGRVDDARTARDKGRTVREER